MDATIEAQDVRPDEITPDLITREVVLVLASLKVEYELAAQALETDPLREWSRTKRSRLEGLAWGLRLASGQIADILGT